MFKRSKTSDKALTQKILEANRDLEKFKLAVEGASDHIVITDADGKIIYANRAAEETTGYTKEEMLGNRPSLWGKQMPEAFYRQMWHTIKEEQQPFQGELTNKKKNGSLYVAEMRIAPLFDEHKALYGFVAIERDVTKQREIEKSKTEFVSIASHQLRTPLTIIKWYAEMLSTQEDEKLSKKQERYLNEITQASMRMIELVNSLLNVSRIDLGTFLIEPEPLNFTRELDDTMQELAPQIKQKRISLIKNIEKDLPVINADRKLLRIILQNLLVNAVTYTPEGGTVTATIAREKNEVIITVADTGIGIPLQQQPKIFQKFFRADNAQTKEPGGNGLGLYIVRSIVQNVGGRIWFTSEENVGTTFCVALPLSGMKKREGSRTLSA